MGWTRILQGSEENLREAEELLNSAWRLLNSTWDLECEDGLNQKYTLAENLAVLNIRQGRYEEAKKWSQIYQQTVEIVEQTSENIRIKKRLNIRHNYYVAELLYRQGRYEEAKKHFESVVKEANEIDWLRFECNAQNLLANIAIKQNQLQKAEKILKQWYEIAKSNHDECTQVYFEYTIACLEKAKNNPKEAKQWAFKALKTFEKLEMKQGISNTQDLIQQIKNGLINCFYRNESEKIQIVKISHPNCHLEKTLLPRQIWEFYAPTSAYLEIHTYSMVTATIEDKILCEKLALSTYFKPEVD